MDFDEYEYLENTVENPEVKKLEGKANGGDAVVEYEEKDRGRSSKRRSVDDDGDDLDHSSKPSRSRNESYEHERERGSRHGSSLRDREKGERDRHTGSREHRIRDKDEGSGKERNRDRERDSDKKRNGGNRERKERDYERDRTKEEEQERSKRTRNQPEKYQDERGREKSKDMEIVDTEFKERRRERVFNPDRDNRGQTVSSILKFFSVHISLNCHFVPQDCDLGFGSFKHTGDICASLLELLYFMNMETSHMIYLFARSKAFFSDFNMQMVKAAAHVLVNKPIKRYKEKKEDKVEPEVDPERDQRTVFAYQITLKAGERDIYEFFSRAGKVRDVRLIMDRNTRRSKGVGYIEFYDVMSVPMAIALSGQPLLGQPVMVKPSEAEKNLVQSTAAGGGGLLGPYSGGARRLYVGNLPLTIKEDQLRQVFEPFGTVELVQMPSDPGTGNCKGYAFIQFARLEDAKAAQNLNGQLEIAGRVIKVSAITDQAGMQDAGANLADLDDDEGSGLSLNAHSRALLMQKLDRTGTASSITGSSAASVLGQTSGQVLPGLTAAGFSMPAVTDSTIDTIGVPSECLLLKNMFDPTSETEPEFDLDIKEDVQDECSKFGRLKHIHVEKNSAGFVYLRFENAQAAIGAQRALHGRWFAGKMITATFMVHNDYEAKFPGSG